MGSSLQYDYMQLALKLAEKGRGDVSPNPMVGCVLVKDQKIIGQGYHETFGGPHAEVRALASAKTSAVQATAYITLEPCCHFGKTPPCIEALIAAKIKKVVIASQDPNPLVAGKGIAALNQAGIETEVGICDKEAQQLNEVFFHFIKNKKPFVVAKWAMSLDGKTITHPDDSRIISDKTSQHHSHQLRKACDAILIGARTAINDNPLLTVRDGQDTLSKQPLRIVLSSDGDLPNDLTLFAESHPGRTIIATTDKFDEKKISHFPHVEILKLPATSVGKVDLHALMSVLGNRGVASLLVEGGATVLESFFAEGLVNKTQVYLAPVIIGKLPTKQCLTSFKNIKLENDLFISAYV